MIVTQSASDKVEVDTEQVANRIDVSTQAVGKNAAPADLNADIAVTVPTETQLQDSHRLRQRNHRERARQHVL